MSPNFIAVDRLTSEDKAFLLETLMEFCASYENYMSGDNEDFISERWRKEVVGKTSAEVERILDRITRYRPPVKNWEPPNYKGID